MLSYYTWGFAGLIYLIIALIRKQGLRPFLRYHVFMSIFLSILIFIVSNVLMFTIDILGYIPYIKAIVFSITLLFLKPITFLGLSFSFVTLFIYGLLTYLAVGAVMGKYSYLPWVSKIISYNLRQ
ncbi:MAG: hypothetical protein K6C94_03785 [Candidatus Gastranaerophilales bacterium]|nr:hypothetical protein [Candidatus Gastranaerophilales bacterium]